MDILLVQNGIYVPTHGGANKANRILLEGLAERGHRCIAVVPATMKQGPDAQTHFLEELRARDISVREIQRHTIVFEHNGVEVHAVTDSAQLRAYVTRQIAASNPTWVLVAAEDPGQVLLKTALEALPERVVYVAQTTMMLPFGPMCFMPSPARTALIQQVAGIITISEYMRSYIQQWGGMDSTVIPLPAYGEGPFARLGRFDQGAVTIINPSNVKGISVFLALAERFPQVPFAAVPTWATTADDRGALEALPNVSLLPPADQIDTIFAQTRVLLVPSLWGEAFGMVSVEAMLRGIPVLASDVGGLPEAKLGVPYVLPVSPITHYQDQFDDRMFPVATVPPQDVTPWVQALSEVLSDQAHYEALSDASVQAARAFVASLSVAPLEHFLEHLKPAAAQPLPAAHAVDEATQKSSSSLDLAQLSPQKRALLALRLKKKAQQEGGGQNDASS